MLLRLPSWCCWGVHLMIFVLLLLLLLQLAWHGASTRCAFICSVIDCGTAAPHAEQTALRQHSQRFPATYIIHHPAVSALPRRRWIVDDARACTSVLCAVGVLLIVVLLHLLCVCLALVVLFP